MTRPLIGLIGKKRSGKDTFAGFLAEFGFVRYAFADPLKATMRDLDPIVDPDGRWPSLDALVQEHGWEAAKEIPEVRRLLQAHGVAIREHVDPDVWLNATMRRVAEEERPVVITDVRFPNEADAVEAAGGVLVRIHRGSCADDDAHISETALDGRLCRFHVANDYPLDALQEAAGNLARIVLSGS